MYRSTSGQKTPSCRPCRSTRRASRFTSSLNQDGDMPNRRSSSAKVTRSSESLRSGPGPEATAAPRPRSRGGRIAPGARPGPAGKRWRTIDTRGIPRAPWPRRTSRLRPRDQRRCTVTMARRQRGKRICTQLHLRAGGDGLGGPTAGAKSLGLPRSRSDHQIALVVPSPPFMLDSARPPRTLSTARRDVEHRSPRRCSGPP